MFLSPPQAKPTCYFLGFVWAELNKYMQESHSRSSINITSNYAPINIASQRFHLSAQYSKRNYDQLGRGRNIHEYKQRRKMELLLTEKLVFAATCTFGGAFVFNRHIHTGTADYKIWNAWITRATILCHAALKWERRCCTNENDLPVLVPTGCTREAVVCTGNSR